MSIPVPSAPTKPWYKSLTVWGGILATLVPTLQQFGVVPVGSDEVLIQGATFLAGIMALIGRARAKGPVTLT